VQSKGKEENDELIKYAREKGLAGHPDRVEIVVFSAEDENEGQLAAHRLIIRGNGKPTLGPLLFMDETMSSSRLVGLLPRRATLQ
jgi:hypothetical protein